MVFDDFLAERKILGFRAEISLIIDLQAYSKRLGDKAEG